MKRVQLQNGSAQRSIPAPISPPRTPKVPKSIRVPDGMPQNVFDGLQNLVTGLGTSKDKSTSTTFTSLIIDRSQQEAAFRGDWIAHKVVTIPAEDATREWRSWVSDNKDIEAIEELERSLHIQRKVFEAMWKGRLYGGAALVLGVDDGGTIESELKVENVTKDGLKFVHVVSRWDLNAGPIDWNIDSPYYGQPSYYTRAQVMQARDVGTKVHPSRVIRFCGNPIPDLNQAQGWGDSVLMAVYDAVIAAGIATTSGSQLLSEMKMDVIKVPDLSASMSNKAYEARLLARFGAANVAKSLYNILLLDKEEEWERIEANFAALPDMLKMYLLIASGAAEIPATRFLSQSPAGMNATGESDIRNHYDMIKSKQNNEVAPVMQPLDEIIIRSALGTFNPGDVVYEWRPLWQMDDKAKSEIAKSKADTFKVDYDTALLPKNVLRDARVNQLIEDGFYPGLEQILDDYGPLEDLDAEEEQEVTLIGPDGQPLEPDPNVPPQAANQNLAPAQKAVGDMARRIRQSLSKDKRPKKAKKSRSKRSMSYAGDAKVATLYVYRKVTNGAAIIKHFADQGVPDLFTSKDLHVTICYSRAPVDWTKTGEAWGQNEDGTMTIKKGGMRTMERYGNNSLVLLFNSSELAYRHMHIKHSCDASWDYDDYSPHITVAELQDLAYDFSEIKPYQGVIELGVEVFEEVKDQGPYA